MYIKTNSAPKAETSNIEAVIPASASLSNKLVPNSDIPTSLPASDVSAWAKASVKPSYSDSEITNLGILQILKPAITSSNTTFTMEGGQIYLIIGFEIHNNGRRAGAWLATYSSVSGEGFGLVNKLIGASALESHMDVTVNGSTVTLAAGFATQWTVYRIVNNVLS